MNRSTHLTCWAIVATCVWASTATGAVTLERDGRTLKKITIDSGKGRIEIRRSLWQNTAVFTESGKVLAIVDPFMYNARTRGPDVKVRGGYWSKPEVFDLWKVEQIGDPKRPGASIVKITAEPPGLGLRKQVTIAVEPGKNVAYVCNAITATEDVALMHDRQCIYLNKPAELWHIWVDGHEIASQNRSGISINRYLLFQHKKTGASAGVAFLDRKAQVYPDAQHSPFGSVTFYANEKANGADCSWGKGSGQMAKDDVRMQQYLLVWGDGDLRERVEELSAKALAGELSDKVHALPKPVTMEDLLEPSDELRVDRVECGAWLPLRTQPTKSRATYQHSTYQSPYNEMQAKKILAGLRDKRPMLLVRASFGRLVIGCEDGLIHGMRPRVLAESYQGSYLRECAEDWQAAGTLEVLSKVRGRHIELLWKSDRASRRIMVWDSGTVETTWSGGPKTLRLYAGCHPYHFLTTDGKTAVRFSQILQRRRELQGASRIAMFGYRHAALEVQMRGMESKAEEIWLDSGEAGWEWATRYAEKYKLGPRPNVDRPFANWARRNMALTYLAGGGIRKVEFVADTPDCELDYCLSRRGSSVMGTVMGDNIRKPPRSVGLPVEMHDGDYPMSKVLVGAVNPSSQTIRIWPNDFHGWELRPLNLVQTNPMPAFYRIALTSYFDKCMVTFRLARAPWMRSAMIESDPRDKSFGPHQALTVPKYRQQPFWREGAPTVGVEPRDPKTVLLRVQPVEQTLGDYEFVLHTMCGKERKSLPLKLRVIPCSMVDPYGNPLAGKEDSHHFGFTGGAPNPLSLEWHYSLPDRQTQDEFLDLVGQQALRKGYWIRDHGQLRHYITQYTQHRDEAKSRRDRYLSVPPDEFVKNMRRDVTMRKPRFPYRYRVYLADEIWEILGGYKGRRYMPIPEVARWSQALIEGCPNPCWYSHQQPGVDAQYQTKLPSDIAELFYYCGRDEGFQAYVHKLVAPRQKLIEKWKQDAACLKRAGTEPIRPMYSFWISGQLHVTDYPTMRRQHWYSKHNGIDIIMFWVFRPNGMIYAGRIGCNSVLGAGTKQVMLTDRSLAWHDLCEDMKWITLVRLLKEKASAETQGKVDVLQKQAFDASQRNEFDLARDCLVRAVRLMEPKYADLVCPHYYSPVTSTPLEDLFKRDEELRGGPGRKRAVIRKLKGGHRPAPTLNATLDNSYLEEGTKLSGFMLLSTRKTAKADTEVYLAWDDEKLYVLYICQEPLVGKLVAKPIPERDSHAVFGSDCAELFIDRNRDGTTFSQFSIGAGGGRYDGRVLWKEVHGKRLPVREAKEWNPKYGAQVAKRETAWHVEMHIPWPVLGGPPKPGETWRMNFARERKPETELSIWSPHEGGFGDPAQFGDVKFVE